MKTCRDCQQHLPLTEFYPHGQMADGHLNKCKTCVKGRVKRHRQDNPDRLKSYDRRRYQTDPVRRAYNLSRKTADPAKDTEAKRLWRLRNPEKRRAHNKVNEAVRSGRLVPQPCRICGDTNVHAHHADYTKPLVVDWLCPAHHGIEHRKAF